MASFTDSAKRDWVVVVNVAAVKRTRSLINIDLLKVGDKGFELLGEIVGDPVKLVDVLYCLCKEQADARSVTDEQFGEAMLGDTITKGADAFMEAMVDFFPDPRTRTGMKKLIDASKKMTEKMMAHALAQVDKIDPATEAEKLIASYGNSPESPGSTPTP